MLKFVATIGYPSFFPSPRAQPFAQPDGQAAGRAGRPAVAAAAGHLAQLLHHAARRRVQDAEAARTARQQQRHHRHRPGRDHHVGLARAGRPAAQPAHANVPRAAPERERLVPDRAVRAGKGRVGGPDDLIGTTTV